ncbi:hypothetical protein M514_18305, partial [Trichuris suis]
KRHADIIQKRSPEPLFFFRIYPTYAGSAVLVMFFQFFSRFRHEDNIVGVEHCMQGHCVLEERTIWSNVVMCQMPFQGRGRPHVAFDSSLGGDMLNSTN